MILQSSLTTFPSDILLNVFLAIAVDNLADADALGDAEEEEGKEGEEVMKSHKWKLWTLDHVLCLVTL